ncbi:MAG TPA: DUF4268 domain-containing protein [Methanocorpusculum sp.]|nr:DUF4268 domain-containing protein [Methanocorpusculum sp.]HJJ40481.1 DUF4268 domain-containing protein [Methanocorpusculum sp.]HJJ49804.1 DUF4268 domain-containing protein [Methanocorpusculum sp.]HJJ57359.1 DUF4268 domain-containing protein [Methanocorpusculum sp.]
MKGEKVTLTEMLRKEDAFSIPVYQRDYSWKKEQCRQLYDDLISTIINHRPNHFFGSIVDAENPAGRKHEYIIIDGQQRITTMSLLILAFRRTIQRDLFKFVDNSKEKLLKKIDRNLYNDDDDIKLTPAPTSKEAYLALFSDDEDDFVKDSDITLNYLYFLHRLEENKDDFTADEIWNAIDNLTIIDIYLEAEDDAQLIFESINSTGVALSESDKVRNYLMMSLDIKEQERYYNEYWKKIEANTGERTDIFLRDYLGIQMHEVTKVDHVYDAFKAYARDRNNEQIIKSILKFSKYYVTIYHPENAPAVFKKAFTGFRKLDMGVADPYLMRLLEGYETGTIPENEVNETLEVIEDYLFRRKICSVPTNALNKIFHTLHTDALKLKGNTDDYSERVKFILMRKDTSGRFPRNDEFLEAFKSRDIYTDLSEKSKLYLLERLENFDNKESHNIPELVAAGSCSIEHVMPQTLNDDWIADLGGEENAKRVHGKWLHKIGNLTFTGYNSRYSNQSFQSKLTMEHGFRDSTFALNKYIAKCTKWTEEEIIGRTALLMEKIEQIWPEPTTEFIEDVVEDGGFVNLAENYNFTNKQMKGFTFEKTVYPATSWKDFLIMMVNLLYEKDPSIMQNLSRTTASYGPANFITASEHDYDSGRTAEIKDGIYVYINSSTWDKLKLIKGLLDLYNIPHSAVEIHIRKVDEVHVDINELATKYWEGLVPKITEVTHVFDGRPQPIYPWFVSNGTFFVRMRYRLLFNKTFCLVGFEFYTNDKELNEEYFDLIASHKDEIEAAFGEKLVWERNEQKRSCFISSVQSYSITDESSWDAASTFMLEKFPKFEAALQPVINLYLNEKIDDADEFDDGEET